MTKVQCRCGVVEIEISAEPIVQFYCHCDDCQAVHGGAYAPESVYSADAVKVVRGVNGYLLPPSKFQPAFHVQCQFAVRPIVDDLPHYKGMPARFGGSDEAVGW